MNSLKKVYHTHSFACHPDHFATDEDAHVYAGETFKALTELFNEAIKKVTSGIYGKADAPSLATALFDMKTKKSNYRVFKHVSQGDYADIYYAEALDKNSTLTDKVCLKVIRDINDNLLISNEIEVMKAVPHKSLPVFLDRFKTKDDQEALIMRYIDGYDFITVKGAYPNGVPQEHLSWIMERCLSVMGFMHYNDVLHCNIEPGNLIVRPRDHNCFLVDFLFSVIKSTKKSRFQVKTEGFSPPEVSKTNSPSYVSDLYSLGKCFLYLAGGNLDNNWLPSTIDPRIQNFILRFIKEDPAQRANDAWGAYHELRNIRSIVFGPKQFLEFKVL